MTCDPRYQKSTLSAYTNSVQSVIAQGSVLFNNNDVLTGCSISHAAGSSTIQLNKAGLYLIEFNADASTTATSGGTITLQLFKNGVIVPGAESTSTATSNTAVNTLSFSKVIQVLNSCNCVNNQTNITVVNTNSAISMSNANIVVVKLA